MVKLEVRGLYYSYGSRNALKDIDLSPEPGKVTGIIGPNGSGKTTLFRCIAGLLAPGKGMVSLDGVNVRAYGRKDLAKKIGFLPQAPPLSGNLTVYETILLGRYPHLSWRVKKDDIARVDDLVGKLALEPFVSRNASELSGGESKRVLIAQAMVREPEVLLLDEPTSSLDLCHQFEICEMLRDATRETGMITLMAVHDLNLAARYSDSLALLKRGGLFAHGRPGVVLTRDAIKEVYEVDVNIVAQDGVHQIIPTGSMRKSNI